METVILRIILLIVLFILLTGDYTALFNQISQQGTKSVPASPDVSRTASKPYSEDDDTDGTHIDDDLDTQCEYCTSFLMVTFQ
jgi:hypothetical protein